MNIRYQLIIEVVEIIDCFDKRMAKSRIVKKGHEITLNRNLE